MKTEAKYHLEVVGQITYEGVTKFECGSLDEAMRKLKGLRKSEIHVHLIKTIKENGKDVEYIID